MRLLLTPLCIAAASGGASAGQQATLCALMRHGSDGAYSFRDRDGEIEVISRRPLEEQDGVGRSSLKGALARHLHAEFGEGSVRWSGAVFDGPFDCGSYKVMTMVVDPLTFKLGESRRTN